MSDQHAPQDPLEFLKRMWGPMSVPVPGMVAPLADAGEIDALNILEATRLAMRRAIENVSPSPDYLLTDAVILPEVRIPLRPIIKGDALSLSIAAASIIAKVTRDRLMVAYHERFPQYNFRSHKGYGTAEHLQMLAQFGACPIHRRTFDRQTFDRRTFRRQFDCMYFLPPDF